MPPSPDWGACPLKEPFAATTHYAWTHTYNKPGRADILVGAYPVTCDGLPHDQHPHPRLWGTFPRVLGHYSRDVGLFPLETAVHKMTGLSARRFNLADRGEIRVGAYADITLFDPKTVLDAATFEKPIATA